MEIGENQQIEFVGDNVLVIKNTSVTNYLAIKIANISSINLEQQNNKDMRITTLVVIWIGLITSLIFGLGLPILIFGFYKHYKLDQRFNLTIHENDKNQPYRVDLPRLKPEDLEFIMHKITVIMSGIPLNKIETYERL